MCAGRSHVGRGSAPIHPLLLPPHAPPTPLLLPLPPLPSPPTGQEGPRTKEPSKYIRYIYNRIILENATVRAAAVSSLAMFGAHVPALRPRVSTLLRRALSDNDDEVGGHGLLSPSLISIFYPSFHSFLPSLISTFYSLHYCHILLLFPSCFSLLFPLCFSRILLPSLISYTSSTSALRL